MSKEVEILKTRVAELEQTVRIQKNSALRVSSSLAKMIGYFDDPKFKAKDSLRFLLTRIYYTYLFNKTDEDCQKEADYIRTMIDLYPK